MGADNTSLQTRIPQQLQLGGSIDSPGRYSLVWSAQVQQSYHETSSDPSKNNRILAIPGGVYMISPLAVVSVWAALKLKLVAWHHLRVWIALWEVRTWRDTMEPAQRNLFRFTPKRIAHVLGNKKTGPRLTQALADLQQLGLALLTPTEISFTLSLDDLQPDLRAETKRMLKSLGNKNTTRAIRMPRRLMRLIMKSRSRPLRVAVVFGMLLRMTPVKRYRWYKGCLTTTLLADVSGFNESCIKHERAALIREGCFERLETPVRVRQQHGDWYALGRDLPVFSSPRTGAKRQPPAPNKEGNRQPPIKKPVPSFGIETNQFLTAKPGASRSTSIPKSTDVPSWHCITPQDLREPRRRAALYEDACHKGVIGLSQAARLRFYAATARARRLGSNNPCGMLRRIVETRAYHGHIADCDEHQARIWLAEDEPPDLGTAQASKLLRSIMAVPNGHQHTGPVGIRNDAVPINPEQRPAEHAQDADVVSYLTHRLGQAGLPTHDAFNLLLTTHEGRICLSGWNRDRWNRASTVIPLALRSYQYVTDRRGAPKPPLMPVEVESASIWREGERREATECPLELKGDPT